MPDIGYSVPIHIPTAPQESPSETFKTPATIPKRANLTPLCDITQDSDITEPAEDEEDIKTFLKSVHDRLSSTRTFLRTYDTS